MTRQQFEEMTADLLERTRFTVVNVMQDAGLKWEDVTRLLLVGGSTRMPMVQKMLKEVSGKEPDRSLSARGPSRPRCRHLCRIDLGFGGVALVQSSLCEM